MSDDPQPTIKVTPCEGCLGLPHGSVNAERLCLLGALSRNRLTLARVILERDTAVRSLREAKAKLEASEKLRSEIQSLPAAWPPDRR